MSKQKLLWVTGLLALVTGITSAQVDTASISGTVKDSSGAVLPGAQIVILNTDTGISRTLPSDAAGRYLATSLALGNYRVTVTQQGFQTEIRSGIVLTVGRDAVVDLAMSVGAVTQTLEVTGEASQIDTTSATVSGLVNGEQMRELPLDGRSYTDLALLNPGVIYNRLATGSSATDGFGVRMSVNGGRTNQTGFIVDGTFTNNASNTGGSVTAQSLGIEGIREFQVLTHNYSAEYGRSAGGVVSLVTRSGTNQFHGSAYEFLRNEDLDARNWTPSGPPSAVQPLRRNQFGGALGGPVIKDRVFFFANYEGLRWHQGSILTGGTLDEAGILSGTAKSPLTGLPYVVNPVMIPYLNIYPKINGVNNGDGTGFFSVPLDQPNIEDYNLYRGDFRLSDKDNMYFRFIYDPSHRFRYNAIPLWSLEDQATSTFVVLSETHIFSPTVVNTASAAFNRTFELSGLGPQPASVPASLSFVPGEPMGLIGGAGGNGNPAAGTSAPGAYAAFGNLDGEPLADSQNVIQEIDALTWIRGAHSLKFGGEAERVQNFQITTKGLRGDWTFPSVTALLGGLPSSLEGRVVGPLPLPNGQTGNGNFDFPYRRSLYAGYALDDWRVSSRLTINLGLRYEVMTDPTSPFGLTAVLYNLSDPESVVGPSPFNTQKNNFAPRLGAAWDPTGSGKNVIRAGAGVYYNQIDAAEWIRDFTDYHFSGLYTVNYPNTAGIVSTFPHLPVPSPALLNGAASEQSLSPYTVTPVYFHYGLDFQRQVTRTLMWKVGYVGWYGMHMPRLIHGNIGPGTTLANGTIFYPSTTTSLNPNFGSTDDRMLDDAVGNYNGLQTTVRKSLGAGLSFQATYTYSRTLTDTDSTQPQIITNTGQYSRYGYNPAADYGLAAYNQTHTFVFNGLYNLTILDEHLHNRLEKGLLGGWGLSGIWQYGSGLPLTIAPGYTDYSNAYIPTPGEPNSTPGFTNNPVSGTTGAGCSLGGISVPAGQKLSTPTLWYNPCAFSPNSAVGTFGNLGRDTVIGPDYNQVNFTIAKNSALTEKVKMQFRVEIFNLFNHPSFALPGLSVFSKASNAAVGPVGLSYAPSSGLITGTTSFAREIQLGLKILF